MPPTGAIWNARHARNRRSDGIGGCFLRRNGGFPDVQRAVSRRATPWRVAILLFFFVYFFSYY
jgi:hypothetical protein